LLGWVGGIGVGVGGVCDGAEFVVVTETARSTCAKRVARAGGACQAVEILEPKVAVLLGLVVLNFLHHACRCMLCCNCLGEPLELIVVLPFSAVEGLCALAGSQLGVGLDSGLKGGSPIADR